MFANRRMDCWGGPMLEKCMIKQLDVGCSDQGVRFTLIYIVWNSLPIACVEAQHPGSYPNGIVLGRSTVTHVCCDR